jgi:hypothetical protein
MLERLYKKHNIHDNFLYMRNLTRRFHKKKTLTLLLNLDISKAFGSVRWDYIYSLMEQGNSQCDGAIGSQTIEGGVNWSR